MAKLLLFTAPDEVDQVIMIVKDDDYDPDEVEIKADNHVSGATLDCEIRLAFDPDLPRVGFLRPYVG